MSVPMNYLDGNAAAGELGRIFADGYYKRGRTVCELRFKETLCRGAFIYTVSWPRRTVCPLRAYTDPPR